MSTRVKNFVQRVRRQWMQHRRRRAASPDAFDLSDAAQVAGFGLLTAGLWMVAAPLALCVAGTLLLVAGLARSW